MAAAPRLAGRVLHGPASRFRRAVLRMSLVTSGTFARRVRNARYGAVFLPLGRRPSARRSRGSAIVLQLSQRPKLHHPVVDQGREPCHRSLHAAPATRTALKGGTVRRGNPRRRRSSSCALRSCCGRITARAPHHHAERKKPATGSGSGLSWMRVVGRTRFELVTNGLKVRCSTN